MEMGGESPCTNLDGGGTFTASISDHVYKDPANPFSRNQRPIEGNSMLDLICIFIKVNRHINLCTREHLVSHVRFCTKRAYTPTYPPQSHTIDLLFLYILLEKMIMLWGNITDFKSSKIYVLPCSRIQDASE